MDQRRGYFLRETFHIHSVPLCQQGSYPVNRANACIVPEGEQQTKHCPQPPYLVRIIKSVKSEPVLQEEIIERPEDMQIEFYVKRCYGKIERNKQ